MAGVVNDVAKAEIGTICSGIGVEIHAGHERPHHVSAARFFKLDIGLGKELAELKAVGSRSRDDGTAIFMMKKRELRNGALGLIHYSAHEVHGLGEVQERQEPHQSQLVW